MTWRKVVIGGAPRARQNRFRRPLKKREDDMREIAGGCLCGKVRYSATADPAVIAVCHCKNCQRQSGTAFGTVVGVPKGDAKRRGNAEDL